MALAQKFGGIAPVVNPGFGTPGINPNARTPPGYGGGGMAQRGEVLGRPTMPTPGAPRTMPPSLGETLGTVTPKPAGKRGAKTTYDPDGGYTEEDNDGTKRVFDKDNKLIDTIIPPGSPGAGTWQPPAEAKKPGIWDRLTDPSLAGIALAAGQQMTRARYPGESGIGNAVNAVTAGYNTLAQQRQMQVARELAEREWQAKQAKAQQDKLESEAKIGDYKSQGERREAQSADERRKARQAAAQASLDQAERDRAAGFKGREVATGEKNAASLETSRQETARQADLDYNLAVRKVANDEAEFQALQKRNASLDDLARQKLKVDQGHLAVAQANSARMAAKEGNEKLLPFMKEAGDSIYGQERNNMQAAYNAGKPYQPIDPAEQERQVYSLAMRNYARAQAAQGKPIPPKDPPAWANPKTDGYDPITGEVWRAGPDGKWQVVPPPRK
jgi:hypothetical protein